MSATAPPEPGLVVRVPAVRVPAPAPPARPDASGPAPLTRRELRTRRRVRRSPWRLVSLVLRTVRRVVAAVVVLVLLAAGGWLAGRTVAAAEPDQVSVEAPTARTGWGRVVVLGSAAHRVAAARPGAPAGSVVAGGFVLDVTLRVVRADGTTGRLDPRLVTLRRADGTVVRATAGATAPATLPPGGSVEGRLRFAAGPEAWPATLLVADPAGTSASVELRPSGPAADGSAPAVPSTWRFAG